MGKPACIRIKVGRGVCGTAVSTRLSQLVPDVHAFPGHIACDSVSESEVVVPMMKAGGGDGGIESCLGVLDIDSSVQSRFSQDDVTGLQNIVKVLMEDKDIEWWAM